MVEDNSLESSVIKFVNGKDSIVSSERVPVTSWFRVVQKSSSQKTKTGEGEITVCQVNAASTSTSTQFPGQVNTAPTSTGTQFPKPKVFCSSSFCNKLNLPGMQCMVIHHSISNKKGNIWLFWNKNLPTSSVVSMSSQMVTVDIGGVLVSGVHAHVRVVQRRFLWAKMEVISDLNFPWLAIGDFNAITSVDEKIGGKAPKRSAMMEFNNCLDTCSLMHAPKTGLIYRWSNCQHESKRILCNLDRVVFNQLWLQKFEDWEYKVGLRVASDHAPLLGGCVNIPKLKNAPMRFQKMWLSHPNFMDVVQNFKEVEGKVQEAMLNSDNNPFDEEALDNLVAAQNLHSSKEAQLHTFLKQKSRNKWIKDGAANTGFLHEKLKIRKARNSISELEDQNGNIISDEKKISEELIEYFEQKFKYKEVEDVEHMLNDIPEVRTSDNQEMIEKVPDEEEIKATLFDMDQDCAPGPDGFSSCFYRSCWDIIHQDVVEAIQFCWRRRFIPKGLNSNFLVLIPKTEGARKPSQYSPIVMGNVNFKIFTKILATRIGNLMHKLVSPQQVAYVKGRCIQDQIILASELVNEMSRKRRCGNVALKLDISQAYDSVNWEFLFLVLQKFGFSKKWCESLHILFQSARISVMVNGGPCGFFSVGRGLRQGDTLSPIIFVLMEEALSRRLTQLIKKMIQMKRSEFPDKYLGVVLIQGRVKTSTLWPMVEMMQKKLAAWKGKLLSFQERLVLIKSVLSSIPVYSMAIYKWPTSVIKICERIMRNFLWLGD
ncbi:uncharacterized protein LOC113280031 [Papaver somniferum]|uniref:uncharacterized protein LOC113280031 n=1 Tax=Papaver somniferum TaxID=3469 RepID=UPI000E70037F|nr:uncharacterized protein LOC113280031 [Papaver somniferum]